MALTKLEIRLEAETTRLQKDLERANRKVNRFAKRASKAADTAKKAFRRIGLAAGVAAGGLALIVKNSITTNDALAKTADKLGLTTDALAGLRHAAELTGIAQNTLDMALQRMTRRIAEAAQGTGEAKAAIKELGLDAKALAAAGPDKAFQMISGAMEETTNRGDKLRLAFKLFDSEGAALVNTLALGEQGLKDAAKEAEQLGIALNRVDAAKMEAAQDAMTRMKDVTKGLGNAITLQLAPVITDLGARFVQAAKDSGGMVNFIGKGMKMVVKSIGFVLDAFNGLKIIFKGLEVAFAFAATGIVKGINFILIPFKALLEALAPFSDKAASALMAIENISESVYDNLTTKQAEFMEALAAPPPSEGLEMWYEELQFKAQAAAEERAAAVRDVQEKSGRELIALDKKEAKARFNIAKGITGNLASLMNSGSKREFEIGKAAAKATAIIKGIEAVQSAYAAGSKVGGPILGAAFAATAALATKANVDAISSQSFSGGGSISSSATSGSVGDLTEIPSQQDFGGISNVNITIEGGVADRDTAEAIATSLRDYISDGGRAFA